ncbi:ephrin-A1-like, partial [Phasianus colchicus]|uniref:ephrin-A1-like n=1 Tax=Phasianus colchicus TaxID=9054 RepID=UPI00129DD747
PPRLARGDLTLHVHLEDHLDIICPHYDPGRPAAIQERYALFLVSAAEHRACAPSSADQLRWRCERPAAPHGAERFSEKFQRFTAFSLGKEFREGSSYYYICEG